MEANHGSGSAWWTADEINHIVQPDNHYRRPEAGGQPVCLRPFPEGTQP